MNSKIELDLFSKRLEQAKFMKRFSNGEISKLLNGNISFDYDTGREVDFFPNPERDLPILADALNKPVGFFFRPITTQRPVVYFSDFNLDVLNKLQVIYEVWDYYERFLKAEKILGWYRWKSLIPNEGGGLNNNSSEITKLFPDEVNGISLHGLLLMLKSFQVELFFSNGLSFMGEKKEPLTSFACFERTPILILPESILAYGGQVRKYAIQKYVINLLVKVFNISSEDIDSEFFWSCFERSMPRIKELVIRGFRDKYAITLSEAVDLLDMNEIKIGELSKIISP